MILKNSNKIKYGFDLSDLDLSNETDSKITDDIIVKTKSEFKDPIIMNIDKTVENYLEFVRKKTPQLTYKEFQQKFPVLAIVCQTDSEYESIWHLHEGDQNALRKIIASLHQYIDDQTINLNWIDVSALTNFKAINYNETFMNNFTVFSYLQILNIKIDKWNVSNCRDMSNLFYTTNFNGDISHWDVSRVENMQNMFGYSDFNGNISRWDVGNVENMSEMFKYSKFDGDISQWNTGEVRDMSHMFENSVFNGDLSHWDVSKCENMMSMFAGSKFDGDINSWDVSNCRDMSHMFSRNQVFNHPLDKWYNKLYNLEIISSMFFNAKSFKQNLSSWMIDTRVVNNKGLVFAGSGLPQNFQPHFLPKLMVE